MATTYQTEYVINGTDATLDVTLSENGTPINWLGTVTRIKVYFGTKVIDSSLHSGVFDWNTGEPGKVSMKLGLQGIQPGVYSGVRILLITPSKPNGIPWIVPFEIAVVDL